MSRSIADTEANAPLRASPDNSTPALLSRRANRLKGWLKVVFLLTAVLIVCLNFWASLRKGEDIGGATSTALAGIARSAAAAAIEEPGAQWKNSTSMTL
jgi:hypothetical protein